MALDHSIFTQLGIYDGPWNPPVNNPRLGNGTAGNDDIHLTTLFAGLVVNGLGGNDRISIDGNANILTTVNGGDGSDQIYGNNGVDVINGGNGNDFIQGGLGADIMSGGAGIDTLSYADFTGSPVVIDLSQLNALGNIDVKVINGNGQRVSNGDIVSNDFENIVGTNFNDTLTGNAGNNVLIGLDGDDILTGGAGDDVLVAGHGSGALYGGDGNDLLVLGHITLPTTHTSMSIDGGDGIDTLDLSGFENVQVFLNEFHGQVADIPDPTLMFINNVENVIGSKWADLIVGGDDNNVITGGGSFDDLTGGVGADTFRYVATTDSDNITGPDTIEDFSQVQGDKIDLQLIDANTNVAGDQAFNFIGNAAFGNSAGELRFNARTNSIEGDVNGDGTADFVINFDAGAPSTATDFIL